MATYAGNKANIYLLSGSSVLNGTPLTLVAGSDTIKYQLAQGDYGKRFLDPTHLPVVKANAVVKTIGPLSTDVDRIIYAGGGVWFRAAQTGPITLESSYSFTASAVAEAREWSLTVEQDTVDSTPMGNSWKRVTPTLQTATGSLGRWYADDNFGSLIRAGTMVGISLEVTTGTGGTHPQALTLYGYLSTQAVKAAVDGLVDESLDFQAIMDVGVTSL